MKNRQPRVLLLIGKGCGGMPTCFRILRKKNLGLRIAYDKLALNA